MTGIHQSVDGTPVHMTRGCFHHGLFSTPAGFPPISVEQRCRTAAHLAREDSPPVVCRTEYNWRTPATANSHPAHECPALSPIPVRWETTISWEVGAIIQATPHSIATQELNDRVAPRRMIGVGEILNVETGTKNASRIAAFYAVVREQARAPVDKEPLRRFASYHAFNRYLFSRLTAA